MNGRGSPGAAVIQPFPKRLAIEPFEPWDFSADYETKPQEWLVEGLIPRGAAVLFSGQTKLGKSYLLTELMICAALGVPWLGRAVAKSGSFALFCEDSQNALAWRRDRILGHLGAHRNDLEGLAKPYPRPGLPNWLMTFDRRTEAGQTTQLFQQLRFYVTQTHEAPLIVGDTIRQTFDGNENSARQVTDFVNQMNALSEEVKGAYIMPHHPPKAGNSEFAGSAAWQATSRVHLHLTRPSYYNPETEDGKDEAILRMIGSNYGPLADDIPLKWDREAEKLVLNPGAGAARGVTQLDRIELQGRILQAARALVTDCSYIATDPASRLCLAARLKQTAGFRHTSRDALQAAVDRLVSEGGLVRIGLGKAWLLRPSDCRYPNEAP